MSQNKSSMYQWKTWHASMGPNRIFCVEERATRRPLRVVPIIRRITNQQHGARACTGDEEEVEKGGEGQV